MNEHERWSDALDAFWSADGSSPPKNQFVYSEISRRMPVSCLLLLGYLGRGREGKGTGKGSRHLMITSTVSGEGYTESAACDNVSGYLSFLLQSCHFDFGGGGVLKATRCPDVMCTIQEFSEFGNRESEIRNIDRDSGNRWKPGNEEQVSPLGDCDESHFLESPNLETSKKPNIPPQSLSCYTPPPLMLS